MREKIVTSSVICVIVMGVLSFCFWNDLDRLRNLVLIWGAPLAIGLAVWRSLVAQWQSEAAQQQVEIAQKQAEVAQRGLLAAQYRRSADLLEHNIISMRIYQSCAK